ncbi:MAG TPA: hypothetical protein VHO01_15630 [Jatrophihabitans sp.]|nr:hypothetical protein [Jatrophihabitans sp.]
MAAETEDANPLMSGADKVADAVDGLVSPADEPGNLVVPDESRAVRWAGPFFALCAALLVPWIVVIFVTLPSRQLSPNYDIAWAGFDVLLCAALASTAITTLRRSRLLAIAAGWASALLVTDAWFDVLTSPAGSGRVEAVIMAVVVELPLAAICLWLSWHSTDIAERRLRLLMRAAGLRPASVARPSAPR